MKIEPINQGSGEVLNIAQLAQQQRDEMLARFIVPVELLHSGEHGSFNDVRSSVEMVEK